MEEKIPKKVRYLFANVIDTQGDGKMNMVSFLDTKGSIGLAVDTTGSGTVDSVYVFQDVTGDGKMDADDEIFLKEKANMLLAAPYEENPRIIYFEE